MKRPKKKPPGIQLEASFDIKDGKVFFNKKKAEYRKPVCARGGPEKHRFAGGRKSRSSVNRTP